jgi:hypothetical protein
MGFKRIIILQDKVQILTKIYNYHLLVIKLSINYKLNQTVFIIKLFKLI